MTQSNKSGLTLRAQLACIPENVLELIEIDTIQLVSGCPRACSHCSQSPLSALKQISPLRLSESLACLMELKEKTGNEMLARYILTSTDSDPFLCANLAKIVDSFYNNTAKRIYLLTSGWFDRRIYIENAEWIANNPNKVEKVALTLSNFPTNPRSLFDNADFYIRAVSTFAEPLQEKFIISPQYNSEVGATHIHSLQQTGDLLDYVLKSAGQSRENFLGRLYFRPIIGIGRADSVLAVQKISEYRIEAEEPPPLVSTREFARPYSGMLDINGNLRVLKAKRAILNRELTAYQLVEDVFGNHSCTSQELLANS